MKMLPPAIALVPGRSVPMSDIQPWLARFKPVICSFTPQMHGVPDVQANVANLKALVALLTSKNIVSCIFLPSCSFSSILMEMFLLFACVYLSTVYTCLLNFDATVCLCIMDTACWRTRNQCNLFPHNSRSHWRHFPPYWAS